MENGNLKVENKEDFSFYIAILHFEIYTLHLWI
jgi:hypothetical protein